MTVDTQPGHFTFLQSANMFTQSHGACLQPCLLVYLMVVMLTLRVIPVRVIKQSKQRPSGEPAGGCKVTEAGA